MAMIGDPVVKEAIAEVAMVADLAVALEVAMETKVFFKEKKILMFSMEGKS